MAVTFDAVGPSSSGAHGTTSPLTWSHTDAASADWLLAGVAVDGASTTTPGATPITAMTYNSVTMGASLLNWQAGGSGQTSGYLAVYGLQNPATGAADTVSATVTLGTTVDGIAGGSLSFITGGGSLGTPQHSDSNGASVTSGSIVVSTTSVSSLVAVFVTNGSGGTSFTAGTQRFSGVNSGTANGGAFSCAGATIPGTGGNVTVSWTQTVDVYAAIAVEVLPPAGGTSGPALAGRDMGQRPVIVVTNAGWRGAQHSR